jgi:hypothetical protein
VGGVLRFLLRFSALPFQFRETGFLVQVLALRTSIQGTDHARLFSAAFSGPMTINNHADDGDFRDRDRSYAQTVTG